MIELAASLAKEGLREELHHVAFLLLSSGALSTRTFCFTCLLARARLSPMLRSLPSSVTFILAVALGTTPLHALWVGVLAR